MRPGYLISIFLFFGFFYIFCLTHLNKIGTIYIVKLYFYYEL
jgi:hypothetical protein